MIESFGSDPTARGQANLILSLAALMKHKTLYIDQRNMIHPFPTGPVEQPIVIAKLPIGYLRTNFVEYPEIEHLETCSRISQNPRACFRSQS
jgi:hypothetical protein